MSGVQTFAVHFFLLINNLIVSIAKIIREQIYFFIRKLISIEGNKFFSKDQGKNGGTTRSGISFGRGEKKKKKGEGSRRNKREHFKFRLSHRFIYHRFLQIPPQIRIVDTAEFGLRKE